MPEEKKVCLFDNSKECPVRKATPPPTEAVVLLESACPICPIRQKMLKDLIGTLAGTR